MSLKSTLGLDGFDLAIQGALTALIMGGFIGFGGGDDGAIGATMTLGISLVVLWIRRAIAMRRIRRIQGEGPGPERIIELEQRMSELEFQAQTRIAELEERLDFTERLLARQSRENLPPAGDPLR